MALVACRPLPERPNPACRSVPRLLSLSLDYPARIVDAELSERLTSIGAVLIDGPKGCGKTETALRQAKSSVRFDTDPNARALLGLNPDELFDQQTPILFDEWQRAPEIWDEVRRHVDELRRRGLYILTGSATPRYERELHSGAGRIGTLRMRPMSLFESGHSTGEASLAALLRGEDQKAKRTAMTVPGLMERIIIGGWPALRDRSERTARGWLGDYLTQIVDIDIPDLGTGKRTPDRLRRALASLGRAVGTAIKVTALAADIAGDDHRAPAKETVNSYLDALDRLKLTENSPAWKPHMRSRTRAQLGTERRGHLQHAQVDVCPLDGRRVSAYGHYVPLMALGKGVSKHVGNDCALGNLAEDGDVVRQLLGESARLHAIGCDKRRAATGAARRRGAGRGTAVSAYSRTRASSATVNGTRWHRSQVSAL
jgi:AAA domain